MLKKLNKIYGEAGKTNASGWSRRRKGAGGVAFALVIVAFMLTLNLVAISVSSATPVNPVVDPPKTDPPSDPFWEPIEKPVVFPEEYNAGIPTLLPM